MLAVTAGCWYAGAGVAPALLLLKLQAAAVRQAERTHVVRRLERDPASAQSLLGQALHEPVPIAPLQHPTPVFPCELWSDLDLFCVRLGRRGGVAERAGTQGVG